MRISFSSVTASFLLLVTLHTPSARGLSQSEAAPKKGATERRGVPTLNTDEILARARQLADDALGLESAGERIKLLVAVGDALWDWDEALARRSILLGFGLALDLSKAPEREPVAPPSPNMLRQIAAVAARHDAAFGRELGARLQEAIAAAEDGSLLRKTDQTQLAAFRLSEAVRKIDKDAPEAQRLFQQSVSARVLPAHCFFLMKLREQSPEAADRLFADTLLALSQRPLAEANEVLVLASYLFSPDDSIGYDLIGHYNAANVSANLSGPPRNVRLARQYLVMMLNRLKPGESVFAPVVYVAFKNLLPQFQSLAPELVDAVYSRMAGLRPSVSQKELDAQERAYTDRVASATEEATAWEDRLRRAEKIRHEGLRDLEYYSIITGHLLPKKDFTNAALVAERLGNPVLRGRLADYVRLSEIQEHARRPASTDFAYEPALRKITDPLLRVIALCQISQVFAERKDSVEARRSLDRALDEGGRIPDEQDRLQAGLMITQLYLAHDAARGFETAVNTLKGINKKDDFDLWRTNFSFPLSVHGMTNELPLAGVVPASMTSAVNKMCRVNCAETFVVTNLLSGKSARLWATLAAVRFSLAAAKDSR